jgi:hypothetical protein
MKNGSDGPPTVPTAEQVRNFLIANAREVGAVAGFRELAETLESLAADVEQQFSDLEHLEKLLNELEVTMVAALKSAQTEEQLAAAKRDLKDQLQPHQGKMTPKQLEALADQYLERRLMDEAGIPRLSLFYMK